jgi:glucose-6-phosphate 1-dehydrogenase
MHGRRPEPAQLVVRLDPSTGIRLRVEAHRAHGQRARADHLDMEFAEEGGEGPAPYEVLLHAAMVGDDTRFTRQDGVEQAWRILQPLLDAPPPVHPYPKGSWGPEAADHLVAAVGGWHRPWVAS